MANYELFCAVVDWNRLKSWLVKGDRESRENNIRSNIEIQKENQGNNYVGRKEQKAGGSRHVHLLICVACPDVVKFNQGGDVMIKMNQAVDLIWRGNNRQEGKEQ